jgi:hypothetical protein
MSAAQPPPRPPAEAVGEAKRLLRVARTAALATLDGAAGAPLTTLVSVASDYDGAPLLLLSGLARHTGNLAADPRGSLLLTSPAGRGDPLNRPRLTIGGEVVAHLGAGARARFIARNPKSKLYASFADFSVFRMEISGVHFNGGFARAAALAPADILTDIVGAESLISMEAALLEEVNARDVASRARLAGATEKRRAWRAIGIDPEGLDLAAGSRAARASFIAPAANPVAWRKALAVLFGQRSG